MKEYLFSTCSIDNECLYFYSNFDGIPAKLDLKQQIISILSYEMPLTLGYEDAIDMMTASDGKIYALQKRGSALMIYDVKRNRCDTVEIKCNDKPWGNFIEMVVYDSKLFIFPRYRKTILIMNCNSRKVETRMYHGIASQYFNNGCRVRDKMWLFPQKGFKIGCFNLATFEYQEYSTDVALEDVVHSTSFENEIYILDRNGHVYEWNTITCSMSMCFEDKEMERMGRIVATKEKIILLPLLGRVIKIYEKRSNLLTVHDEYPNDFVYEANPIWSKYYGRCEDNKKIYFAMRSANYMLIIDKESGEIKWMKPKLPAEDERYSFIIRYNKKNLLEQIIPLPAWLKHVQKSRINNLHANLIGEKIWDLTK